MYWECIKYLVLLKHYNFNLLKWLGNANYLDVWNHLELEQVQTEAQFVHVIEVFRQTTPAKSFFRTSVMLRFL